MGISNVRSSLFLNACSILGAPGLLGSWSLLHSKKTGMKFFEQIGPSPERNLSEKTVKRPPKYILTAVVTAFRHEAPSASPAKRSTN